MSTQAFNDILKRAREELSQEERDRLACQLLDALKEKEGDSPTRTLYDALAARGIIGSIQDAPPDLSTNPAYMEGLGQNAR